jgi:hypothetical protein
MSSWIQGEIMTSQGQPRKALLGKLTELTETSVDAPCRIGEIHKQLDPETAQALLNALRSAASTSAIHKAIKDEGLPLSRHTLNQKRKCFRPPTDGECLCFPNNTGA